MIGTSDRKTSLIHIFCMCHSNVIEIRPLACVHNLIWRLLLLLCAIVCFHTRYQMWSRLSVEYSCTCSIHLQEHSISMHIVARTTYNWNCCWLHFTNARYRAAVAYMDWTTGNVLYSVCSMDEIDENYDVLYSVCITGWIWCAISCSHPWMIIMSCTVHASLNEYDESF